MADEVPRNWSFVNDVGTCALETRPADPYSITVTCVSVEGTLYVGSMRAPSKTWPKHVLENSQVRYEADGTVYELQAMLVDEEDDRRSAWRGRRKLAGEDPPEDAEPPEDYWIFRLEPRDRAR